MAANKKKKRKNANHSPRTKSVNKRSNWIIGSIVALFAVLVLAVGIYLIRSWKAADTSSLPAEIRDSLVIQNGDEAAAQAIADDTQKHEDAVGGFSEIAHDGNAVSSELQATNPPVEGESSTGTGWSGDSSSAEGETGNGNWGIGYVPPSSKPAPPVVVAEAPEIPTISFPYTIPETALTILQVSPYSGYFLEDGSGDEISNVMTIVLKNDGGDMAFVGIGLAQGDRNLAFSGSNIPAGATVIIQEQRRAAYMDGPFYSATGTTTAGGFSVNPSLSITDNGNNTFSVTNLSDERIESAVISYKSYLPEEDVYVGGITYTVNLKELEPGSSMTVYSSHYVSGYSVILSAQSN